MAVVDAVIRLPDHVGSAVAIRVGRLTNEADVDVVGADQDVVTVIEEGRFERGFNNGHVHFNDGRGIAGSDRRRPGTEAGDSYSRFLDGNGLTLTR